MIWASDADTLLIACAVYGFSVGNVITFPALIVQREFEAAAFGMLIGLSTGIGQFTYAFGPGLLGVVRDVSGGYGAALALCIALKLTAAAMVLRRPRADPERRARANACLPRVIAASALDRAGGSADGRRAHAGTPPKRSKLERGGRSPPTPGCGWLVAVLLGTIGSVGMWAYVVALPAVQADFGVARADASLPYTLAMLGFGIGAVAIGGLVDRFGVVGPVIAGTLLLGLGFVASGLAPNLMMFAIANLVIGVGSSATFAPLIADISHWFTRRRGIAVAICASGNYIGGAVWPPIVQQLIEARRLAAEPDRHRPHLPLHHDAAGAGAAAPPVEPRRPSTRARRRPAPPPRSVSTPTRCLPCCAWRAWRAASPCRCRRCTSSPTAPISATARRAAPRCSRPCWASASSAASPRASSPTASAGWRRCWRARCCRRVALLLYLLFDGLTPLYVISALFGLFQGGIVPMYAVIVREYFPPSQAGTLVGLVIMSTILGMALGGWMSGAIFDLTGSYWQAFANGLLWNLLNVSIAALPAAAGAGTRAAAAIRLTGAGRIGVRSCRQPPTRLDQRSTRATTSTMRCLSASLVRMGASGHLRRMSARASPV